MKILMMCLSDPSGDPRPNRFIKLLSNQGHFVDLLSYSTSIGESIPIKKKFFIKNRKKINPILQIFRGIYFRIVHAITLLLIYTPLSKYIINQYIKIIYNTSSIDNELFDNQYDLLFIEDLVLLPLAFRIQYNAKIIFDAREYYPKQYEHDWFFRMFESPIAVRLCRYYLPKCDQIFTVSSGLARAYEDEFNVIMEILRSTPTFWELNVNHNSSNSILMVHHGIASPNRKICNMIKVVKQLDRRFTLDLYLIDSDSHIEKLKRVAAGCERIRFFDPVPYDDIIPMLNRYDIGFFYVEPTTFNLEYCLPNKFFEYIQARLMIAIGPSPEMAEIINEFQCGVVAPEFKLESMIETLESLNSEDIHRAKLCSNNAAQILCYEKESIKFLEIISKLETKIN